MGLGRTMALAKDKDLVIIENDTGGKTFAMVEGRSAVSQGLRIRLQTKEGESTLHPGMGLPISRIIATVNPEFLTSTVASELGRDPRVATVDEVSIVQDPSDVGNRVVGVFASITLKDGTEINELIDLR